MGKQTFLNALPIPASAIGLSFVGLANLFSETKWFSLMCQILGGLILFSVLLKIVWDWSFFNRQIRETPIASIVPTLSMGIILLSKFLLFFGRPVALVVWLSGIIIQFILMIYFTKQFVVKKQLSLVLPGWFVVYVGIVVTSMTAPAFGMATFGRFIYIFGLIAYLILLPLILFRLKRLPLPEPLRPTVCILAAPASLNLAGYMISFEYKMVWFIILQLAVSQFFYWMIVLKLPKLVMNDFYPTIAALTFPMVISAVAFKLAGTFLSNLYSDIISFFQLILLLEKGIALVVVLVVLSKYIRFMITQVRVIK